MSGTRQGWKFRWLAKAKVVPIRDCVHFGAFRYGCGDVNPYEEYAMALVRGGAGARAKFTAFLQHYRPRELGAALGVQLSRTYGLWQFPWEPAVPGSDAGTPGWVDDPNDATDIITHFSERGILKFRIEEEFLWAEKLCYSLQRRGFAPRPGERPIEAQELVRSDGAIRYLIIDGNHRISALAARGDKTVTVRSATALAVREAEVTRWPRVRDGSFSAEDAARVLRAYFDGNQRTRTTEVPARIVEIGEAVDR